jgi:RHS repeat-associated protein
MTESLGGVTSVYVYTYDARGRLTDITKDGSAVEHYVYDANGNRSSATVNGTTVSGAYDARDRMESYGNATYTYLASGELATKTVPGTGITTYDYDELGSLTHVELPNGDDVNYNVDGVGRRVTRKFNGTVTNRYQYGTGLQPVAELDASGNTVSTFVYGSRGNVPDYMIKGGVNYRLVTDHVGSVRMVVNSSTGAVAQRIDYDSFGNVLSDTNPGFQPFAFAGGLYDAATALTRFGARDYDAQTGRWTAKDPILFRGGSPNLYVYVGSDPVNFGDADGLLSVRDVFGGAGQAFSNVIKGLTNAISSLMTNASCLVQGLRDYVVEIYSPFLSGEGWSQAQQMIEESAVWRGTVDTAQCAGGNLEVVIGTVNGALSLVELAGARLLNPFQNAAAHGLTAAGIEDDQQTIREGMRVIGRECFHRDWL